MQKNPLAELLKLMGLILDCAIRHEGLGDRVVDPETGLPACDKCSLPAADLRCRGGCLFEHVLCTTCILAGHAELPLHKIEVSDNLSCLSPQSNDATAL